MAFVRLSDSDTLMLWLFNLECVFFLRLELVVNEDRYTQTLQLR